MQASDTWYELILRDQGGEGLTVFDLRFQLLNPSREWNMRLFHNGVIVTRGIERIHSFDARQTCAEDISLD